MAFCRSCQRDCIISASFLCNNGIKTASCISGASFLFRLYQLYSTYIHINEHSLPKKIWSIYIIGVTVAIVRRHFMSLGRLCADFCMAQAVF